MPQSIEDGADTPSTEPKPGLDALYRRPADWEARWVRTQAWFQAGKIGESCPDLAILVADAPADLPANILAEVWALYGVALDQLGQPSEAIKALERSLALDPACDISLTRLPFTLQSVGEDAKATAAYLALLRKNPGEIGATRNVAGLLADQGREDDLFAVFRSFHRAGGDDPQATLLACECAMQFGAPERIWPMLERSLASTPEAEALLHYRRLFKRSIGDAGLVGSQINSSLASGDRDGAIALARYAVDLGLCFDDRDLTRWILHDAARDGHVKLSQAGSELDVAFTRMLIGWPIVQMLDWREALRRHPAATPALLAWSALFSAADLEAPIDHAALDRAAEAATGPVLNFLVGAAYRLARRGADAERHLRRTALDDPEQLGPIFELLAAQALSRRWEAFGDSLEGALRPRIYQLLLAFVNLAVLLVNAEDNDLAYQLMLTFETKTGIPFPILAHQYPAYRVYFGFNHPNLDMGSLTRETAAYAATVRAEVDRVKHHTPRIDGSSAKARIGYLFGMGASAFVLSPLHFTNRRRYETFLYLHDLPAGADIHADHTGSFDTVRTLGGLSDDAILDIMIADDLDLLIVLDCVGIAAKDHVVARRPARRIFYYGNGFAPTGLGSVDGLILPATMAACFNDVMSDEAVIAIPDWVNLVTILGTRFLDPLPELGDAPVTLGSIANTYKMNIDWFRMVGRVMARAPGVNLRLDVPVLHPSGLRRIHGLAREAGIEPDRLSIAKAVYNQDFSGRLAPIWLALDSFPVGSYFSAIQALSAGVPLLTFPGKTPLGLGAATILNATGLQNLICPDLQAMEDLAVTLLQDPERLRDLRRQLPQTVRASKIGDMQATATAWEAALDEALAFPVRQLA